MRGITHWTPAVLVAIGLGGAAAAASTDGGVQMIMKGLEATDAPGLDWTDAKSIPPGAKAILVYGSPDKPGPYVFRVRFPAGYKLPPHKHEDQRQVTVLSGSYWTAVGESYAQDKLHKYKARDYYITEANVPHFAWAETDVVIQESGWGPVNAPIEYVNKADDPRK